VKIDRSFVKELDGSVAIVGAVVQMAHSIGLRVVAEGVEEREQVERLVALGCDVLQGFFLGPPVPADDVAAAGEEAAARFAEATGFRV
jgi:EAL domain-containing protein (putative c-di-GMP-specific phosphodiesterase class I)